MTTQQSSDIVLTAAIGETVSFWDYPNPRTETIAARRGNITITRDAIARPQGWRQGALTAWIDTNGRATMTGWAFGSDTTPEQAIDRVIAGAEAWQGLARGAAESERFGD